MTPYIVVGRIETSFGTGSGRPGPNAAIVLVKPADFNIVEGAIVTSIPLLCEPREDLLAEIRTGERVAVDGATGEITVR